MIKEKYPACRFHLSDPDIIAILFPGPEHEGAFSLLVGEWKR